METQLSNIPAGENNPLDHSDGPWSIELTADYPSLHETYHFPFCIELAGTGAGAIDWGDGTLLENFRMTDQGTEHTHQYDKVGTYPVKISGQGGAVTLLKINEDDGESEEDYDGYFSSLVLTRCNRLQYLYGGNNRLTLLDVGGCAALKELNCWDNRLTSLDVSRCPELKVLECDHNQLTALNVGKNLKLERLSCLDNRLTMLDVSWNRKLESLWCCRNSLSAETMNQIYNDLPVIENSQNYRGDTLVVDRATAGDYRVAESKGWKVKLL